MSELKVKGVDDVYIEYFNTGNHDLAKVYLKTEVDHYIAELEQKHKKEVEQLLILNREQANDANRLRDNMEQAIRRYKYKHCLDMAYKCVVLCQKSKDLYRWTEDENLEHYYNHKIEFFARWHNRWLQIAEYLKEAK